MMRFIASFVLGIVLFQSGIAPAFAMSTSTEVAQGTKENAQIDASSIVIDDPYLTSWVNRIGGQLAQFRRRQDIHYRFTILADPSINAFAIKGGYVHVNLGLLNFVSSDDELSSILGHEMGHVELRHVVKSSNTNTIIGILTALASILSPVGAVLASLGGELVGQKYSRIDELQADHYGLELMARAGYDPEAAIDVMSKLGSMEPGPDSRADKAFLDHPVPSDRIAHLRGYTPLDQPTASALLAHAVHDQSEGRYNYARVQLRTLAARQSDPEIAAHISQLDYALRESGSQAAPDGRVFRSVSTPNDPVRVSATQHIHSVQTATTQAFNTSKTQARTGEEELASVEHKINVLSANMPGPGSGLRFTGALLGDVAPVPGPQGGGMAALSRAIDGTLGYVDDVLVNAPGLIRANTDTLNEMSGPFADPQPLTPKYQALLQYYPAMTSDINDSTAALLSSIQLARDALAKADSAAEIMRTTFAPPTNNTQQEHTIGSPSPRPMPDLHAVVNAWNDALAAATRASNTMYAAQATTLSSEITLLDLFSSPERYAAYRQALAYRFPGVDLPDFHAVQASGVRPGELACAAWMSFETNRPVSAVLDDLKSSGRSCENTALRNNTMTESMEIAVGLIYENYLDEPQHPN